MQKGSESLLAGLLGCLLLCHLHTSCLLLSAAFYYVSSHHKTPFHLDHSGARTHRHRASTPIEHTSTGTQMLFECICVRVCVCTRVSLFLAWPRAAGAARVSSVPLFHTHTHTARHTTPHSPSAVGHFTASLYYPFALRRRYTLIANSPLALSTHSGEGGSLAHALFFFHPFWTASAPALHNYCMWFTVILNYK